MLKVLAITPINTGGDLTLWIVLYVKNLQIGASCQNYTTLRFLGCRVWFIDFATELFKSLIGSGIMQPQKIWNQYNILKRKVSGIQNWVV